MCVFVLEHGCFVDFAEQLAAGDKSNSSSIFVDQVKHHYLPRETVLKDLKKLIQANVIKVWFGLHKVHQTYETDCSRVCVSADAFLRDL